MKYIKEYEKYKIGDYVLLNKKLINDDDLPDTYALIYDIVGIDHFFDVKFPNSMGEHDGYEVEDAEIIRKLTKREIEEYKYRVAQNKYNL